jgi:argininosuccinate synthase
MTDRVVLAYSGGLDTSVAIPYLADQTGAEVIAVALDVGQGGEDLEAIRQRALSCGAVEAVVVDARAEFAADFCMPALAGQRALHGPLPAGVGTQPAVDRQAPGRGGPPYGGTIVSHGCTGQGQRPGAFEVGIGALARSSR